MESKTDQPDVAYVNGHMILGVVLLTVFTLVSLSVNI
jgi:hypothetical protein